MIFLFKIDKFYKFSTPSLLRSKKEAVDKAIMPYKALNQCYFMASKLVNTELLKLEFLEQLHKLG